MMLKVLLLSPPVKDYYATAARREPLGLLYVRSALEGIPGVEVTLHDARMGAKKKQIPRPGSFTHLDHIYEEDHSYFSLFHRYYRFGESYGAVVAFIKEGGYHLVGISALFSGYFPDLEDLVARIKTGTAAMVAVGGWAVEAEGERLYDESTADFFLRGSGETGFPALVEALLGRMDLGEVPGLMYRRDGRVHSVTPRYDAVPEKFPRRMPHFYRFKGKKIAAMIVSRGCKNRCSFCAVRRSGHFSRRSIESIERELDYLSEAGIDLVNFEDDNLLDDPLFAAEFISLLKKFSGRGLGFAAMNGITASTALPFLEDLIRAGFREFNFSMVTGSSGLADAMGRPFSPDVIREAVDIIRGRVETIVYTILGLPGSSPRQAADDIAALAKLPVTIGVSPLYLIPGVPLLERLGMPRDRRLLRGSGLYAFGEGFTREDVASLWKFARMANHMKRLIEPAGAEDGENLHFYDRSVAGKRWYRKQGDGSWMKSFSFSVDLPVSGDMR